MNVSASKISPISIDIGKTNKQKLTTTKLCKPFRLVFKQSKSQTSFIELILKAKNVRALETGNVFIYSLEGIVPFNSSFYAPI